MHQNNIFFICFTSTHQNNLKTQKKNNFKQKKLFFSKARCYHKNKHRLNSRIDFDYGNIVFYFILFYFKSGLNENNELVIGHHTHTWAINWTNVIKNMF